MIHDSSIVQIVYKSKLIYDLKGGFRIVKINVWTSNSNGCLCRTYSEKLETLCLVGSEIFLSLHQIP